jgi:Ser/Thr protein kinase RdoA (MazF antagonist)
MSETNFANLTPDVILDAVEQAMDIKLTGLTAPLPSYINRVYELQTREGERIIAKFYRPGRWSAGALSDELQFVTDCALAEIPVVPPFKLCDGQLLGDANGIPFAVYPKRSGRQLEIKEERDWARLGSLVARVHLAGEKRTAQNRIVIDPMASTLKNVDYLCTAVIPPPYAESYRNTAMRIIDMSAPLFAGLERIRVHGDCHAGNIFDRLEQGLIIIDFDDMAMSPPVQDIWLLLPERAENSQREIDLLLRGYEQFRRFDRQSLRCIEPLRAMRMIHFAAWVSRQAGDFQFARNFPDWGSGRYWQNEINDLREQLGFIT